MDKDTEIKAIDRVEISELTIPERIQKWRPKNIFVTAYPSASSTTDTLMYTGITDTSKIQMRVCNNSATADTIRISIGSNNLDVASYEIAGNDTIDPILTCNILTGTQINIRSTNWTTKFTIYGEE